MTPCSSDITGFPALVLLDLAQSAHRDRTQTGDYLGAVIKSAAELAIKHFAWTTEWETTGKFVRRETPLGFD